MKILLAIMVITSLFTLSQLLEMGLAGVGDIIYTTEVLTHVYVTIVYLIVVQ